MTDWGPTQECEAIAPDGQGEESATEYGEEHGERDQTKSMPIGQARCVAVPSPGDVHRPRGRPDRPPRRYAQYAFDPSVRAQVGIRSREWTAVAATELDVIRELARCLRLIREGRVPE